MTVWFANIYHTEIAGNGLDHWLYALGATVVLFLALKLLFAVLERRILSLSKKTSTIADDLLAAALGSTKSYILFVAAVWGGTRFLDLGSWDMHFDFALLIAVVLQAAIWGNRMVSCYITYYTDARREDNPGAVSVVQGVSFIVRLVIWSVAFLLVVDNLGYDVTALVAGMGIGGIAVALAIQNILGDLFASLSIVLDKPFVIGDFIIVGELMGGVEKIGLKTTRVRSLSGEQLIFSNSDLLNSRIRNYKRMQERRIPFGFGVTYQTTPDQLEAIPPLVKSIIKGVEGLRFDRAHFKSFGDSSYDFEVVYYINSPDFNAYMDAQQTINLALCRAFAERGIEFAYPTRTLYMHRAGDGAAGEGDS
ncbi:mechanosensitive ion channel family protein [Coraliomargarita algicola]|uniref:Mechanosensitive ion channel family protein n=1 Tax=Coraliomargarita algicola TaxID=3092156 RepID=A0ABZ0RHT9_9BACT|nr:mechanosensitive ion channel family protein [Coraliomargarita sp. J2-16]WPJ94951.1 mechanosensitive ion channel family protein [Coraliomargarita sp. J2-16]